MLPASPLIMCYNKFIQIHKFAYIGGIPTPFGASAEAVLPRLVHLSPTFKTPLQVHF